MKGRLLLVSATLLPLFVGVGWAWAPAARQAFMTDDVEARKSARPPRRFPQPSISRPGWARVPARRKSRERIERPSPEGEGFWVD